MRFLAFCLPTLTLWAACAAGPEPDAETDPRLLAYTRTLGYRHPSIEAGLDALSTLASRHGLVLEATEDPSAFTEQNLARFHAVVFLSTTGDVLDETQQAALTAFVQAGGGYVGIHAASDTEYDWPWYGRLVGAWFDGHPRGPNVREGTLHVVEPRQPATEGLPDPWIRRDEWYDVRDLQPGLTVLLEIDEQSYKTPSEHPAMALRPIAWQQEFDGGRSFYTALGHTSATFGEAAFLDHLWGGLRFVLDLDGS